MSQHRVHRNDKVRSPSRAGLSPEVSSVTSAPRQYPLHVLLPAIRVTSDSRDVSFLAESSPSSSSLRRSTSPSLIPEEFRLFEESILSSPSTSSSRRVESGTEYSSEARKWQTKVFPSLRPSGRKEVRLLTSFLDKFVAQQRNNQDDSDAGESTTEGDQRARKQKFYSETEETRAVYSATFFEVVRQVTVQCAERGQLLARLWRYYDNIVQELIQQGDQDAQMWEKHREDVEALEELKTENRRLKESLLRERDESRASRAEALRAELALSAATEKIKRTQAREISLENKIAELEKELNTVQDEKARMVNIEDLQSFQQEQHKLNLQLRDAQEAAENSTSHRAQAATHKAHVQVLQVQSERAIHACSLYEKHLANSFARLLRRVEQCHFFSPEEYSSISTRAKAIVDKGTSALGAEQRIQVFRNAENVLWDEVVERQSALVPDEGDPAEEEPEQSDRGNEEEERAASANAKAAAGASALTLPDPLEEKLERIRLTLRKGAFRGLGADSAVPVFLRARGKIRYKRLSKRDIEAFLREMWRQRESEIDRDDAEREPVNFPLWYTQYLKKQYGIQAAVSEWAYNTVYAAWEYRDDADCELFLYIVSGAVSEDVALAQKEETSRFLQQCEKHDRFKNGGRLKRKLPRSVILSVLEAQFPGRNARQRAEMEEALAASTGGKGIPYTLLFEEDREGNQGQFAEAFRDQMLEERSQFVSDASLAILQEAERAAEEARHARAAPLPTSPDTAAESPDRSDTQETSEVGDSMSQGKTTNGATGMETGGRTQHALTVTHAIAMAALRRVDPESELLHSYVCAALRVDPNAARDELERTACELSEFLTRFSFLHVVRKTPPREPEVATPAAEFPTERESGSEETHEKASN